MLANFLWLWEISHCRFIPIGGYLASVRLSDFSIMPTLNPLLLRKRLNLTQRQISEFVGVKRETVSDWEVKRKIPRLRPSQLKRMLTIYQCSIDELIEAFEGDG